MSQIHTAPIEVVETGNEVAVPPAPPIGAERGRSMGAEEYLAHVAYAYAASPEGSAEESIAKGLLELACDRLGQDPQEVINEVLKGEPGGRVRPPWINGGLRG